MIQKVGGFKLVQFTDRMSQISARNNLRDTQDRVDNINDIKNEVIEKFIK